MKQTRNAAFSVVEIIIVGAVVLAFVLVGVAVLKRGKNNDYPGKPQSDTARYSNLADDHKPVLLNLGGIHPATDMKQDLMLIDSSREIEVQTYLFGQKMIHTYQADRINPNFDFRGISRQLDVISPIEGKIVEVKDQQAESKDYEVVIAANDHSTWIIALDHLVDLVVKKDDAVTAGQKIGKAAPYLAGTFYYEFQVNHKSITEDKTAEYVCPTTLLAEKVRRGYVNEMNQLTAAWTSFRGKDFYGAHDGGCVVPTLDVRDVDS